MRARRKEAPNDRDAQRVSRRRRVRFGERAFISSGRVGHRPILPADGLRRPSDDLYRPSLRRNTLSVEVESEIREIVDRETLAWDTQDVDLLLSVFHPDMVWPWPSTYTSVDPVDWRLVLGRFDEERWRRFFEDHFAAHELVHNRRSLAQDRGVGRRRRRSRRRRHRHAVARALDGRRRQSLARSHLQGVRTGRGRLEDDHADRRASVRLASGGLLGERPRRGSRAARLLSRRSSKADMPGLGVGATLGGTPTANQRSTGGPQRGTAAGTVGRP